MFGYIIVNKPEMKFREFDVYHGYYCGLCRKLKEHYGKFGQITLSYDMVFVLMTLTSLYEPETTKSMKRCVTHPLQKHEERVNNITDYVAHMNILLTYYKCKDDWNDDRKLEKLVLEKILYHKSGFSRNFYREKWNKINDILEKLSEEEKKDNLINTFDALLEMGAIPIVNENDSVSYTEIESNDQLFGDNDMLSSVVAVLCRASKLVIFSDIDGFYNCDPRLHPDAKLIEEIDKIDDEVYKLAGGAGSRRGTGGMRTKLQAAALATSQGIDTIITNGKNPAALYNIIEGVPVGTKFKAQ